MSSGRDGPSSSAPARPGLAQLPRRAPPRHDPPVVCPGFELDKFRFEDIRGHALHKKGLQRQTGVGTLVSSQQRKALAVPLLNRGSTAGQLLVNRLFCSSTGLHRISFVRSSEESFRTVFFGAPEGKTDG